MGRIHVLPDVLINKIAAGEVVERPASVVKELCENAIDAEATRIVVKLTEGGLASIQVSDDGVGMSEADTRLCLERHATSKLSDVEGLFQITTNGFRGEAIPAIASVSHFHLRTSERDKEAGTHVFVDGGKLEILEPIAPIQGTVIDVEDLFFNTPARRKYMKKSSTELSHCEDVVWRLALGHPNVSFILEHDGREVLSAPKNLNATERIAAALGVAVKDHLVEVNEQRLGISVTGHIALPEMSWSNARGLLTFVNRRYVRDRGLNFSVQRGFHDTLPPGRQPVAVLFIDVEPEAVDVNVHPQKLEVRFSEARWVQEAVTGGIRAALRSHLGTQSANAGTPEKTLEYAAAVERFLNRASPGTMSLPNVSAPDGNYTANTLFDAPSFGELRPGIDEAPPHGFFRELKFIGKYANRFWLCENISKSLVILDPRAGLARLIYAQLVQSENFEKTAQSQLFSKTVELEKETYTELAPLSTLLESFEVAFEDFGNQTAVIRSAPNALTPIEWRETCSEIVKTMRQHDGEGLKARTALILAKAAARAEPFERTLTENETRAFFEQLDAVNHYAARAAGRLIIFHKPFLDWGDST